MNAHERPWLERENARRTMGFALAWDRLWAELSQDEREVITADPLGSEAEAFSERVEKAAEN